MVVRASVLLRGGRAPRPGVGVRAKVARKRSEDRVVQQDLNQKLH